MTYTAAKMKSSPPHPPPWCARKPSELKHCALGLTAPSLSHHSNSEVFRSDWVRHKVGQVFTERFHESKSWLGKAKPLSVRWWAVTHSLLRCHEVVSCNILRGSYCTFIFLKLLSLIVHLTSSFNVVKHQLWFYGLFHHHLFCSSQSCYV